jgi:Flp pilus assembly protein TadD
MIYRAPLRVDIGEAEQALRGIRRALSSIRPSDRTTRAVALNNRGVAHEKLGRAALARCAYRATIPEADRGSE